MLSVFLLCSVHVVSFFDLGIGSKLAIFSRYKLLLITCLLSSQVNADEGLSLSDLKALSIGELSSLEVGIASKIPSKLNETPAAVYVITAEDIRRSAAANVPDALRMVPGINVGAVSGNTWAVNSRGFNETFANKFLVLLDGRSLYNSTFGGVYWDMQDIRVEDIERIEVIRGPGSAAWGANAMNGVINIITRSSYSSQSGELTANVGSQNKEAGFRYGGEFGDSSSYRFSGKVNLIKENKATSTSGLGVYPVAANDDAKHLSLSLRTDTYLGLDETVTFDVGLFNGYSDQRQFKSEINPYAPDFFSVVLPQIQLMQMAGASQQQLSGLLSIPAFGMCTFCLTDVRDRHEYSGWHVLGRWNQISETDWTTAQAYFDYTQREEYMADQSALVLDIDLEKGWKHERGKTAVGIGLRSSRDDISPNLSPTPVVIFNPQKESNNTINLFAQNELNVTESFRLLSGLGYEYSSITGSQWQPTFRGVWLASPQTQVWGALSYSSRTPSRIERTVASNSAYQAFGNSDHKSEKLSSLELGIRYQPTEEFSLDVVGFRYWYDDLTTLKIDRLYNPLQNQSGLLSFGNEASADAFGAEVAIRWQVLPSWSLAASYSWLQQSYNSLPQSVEPTVSSNKSPEHQFALRSYWDINPDWELDVSLYYVSELSSVGSPVVIIGDAGVDAYLRTDVRLGWQISPEVELSFIGQNLFDNAHQEFNSSPINVGGVSENTEIKRSLSAKLTVRF